VKKHLRAIVSRWMDPNADGDPSDGIDGWRLDVAAELPLAFWKEFRTWVHAIRPDAFLTGEIWWDDYKVNKMMNAAPWLQGDAFDSVMNYRYGDAVLQFVNPSDVAISATRFGALLEELHAQYGYRTALGIQNYIGSHDVARLASAVANPTCRLDHGAGLKQNRDYQVRAPDAEERQRHKLIIALHMLSPGAPVIFYGDEAGLWGADDPDCRKPMVWQDLDYQQENYGPFGAMDRTDNVAFDHKLATFYREIIAMRQALPALMLGNYEQVLARDPERVFAFKRSLSDHETVAVVCNAGRSRQTVSIADLGVNAAWQHTPVTGEASHSDDGLTWDLGAWSCSVFRLK
jgi:cyclomaltodextrinase